MPLGGGSASVCFVWSGTHPSLLTPPRPVNVKEDGVVADSATSVTAGEGVRCTVTFQSQSRVG